MRQRGTARRSGGIVPEEHAEMKCCEALVIGAGPVGLLAALCLHHHDVQARVVDGRGRRPVRGYACGLHAATLAILNEVGLLPEALELGHRIEQVVVHRGFERIGTVELGGCVGSHRGVLALRQSDLEEILVAALEQRGVPISWCQDVTHLALDQASVEVTVWPKRSRSSAAPTKAEGMGVGQPETHRVDYVIGADGYHSACRRALGIELLGEQQSQAFAVCEFLADLSGWEHEAHVVLTEDSVNAFWPLGPSLGRWTFQVRDRLDEAPSLTSLRELIRERAGWFGPNPEQLCWGEVADFPQRRARRFGSGRVWLAGDSAHSTGPLGFQSLNRGLCEASALAAVIGRTCHGRARRARPFEQFDLEQQREWRRLLEAEADVSGDARLSSAEAARIVPCLPASGGDLDALLAQLGSRLARAPDAS
jgi:2-polyprenyl-6-methoxyphenol hydroxylase-like FAD-dependent oxidoreductase